MTQKHARVIVADHASSLPWYQQALATLPGASLVIAPDADSAMQALTSSGADAILVSVDPPGWDGLALLANVRRHDSGVPVILIDRQPSAESAATALRLGANDYLSPPMLETSLAASLARIWEERRRGAEHALLRRHVERSYTFDEIIGASATMKKVFDSILQVAETDVDVLVCGETGTGKELVARSIHRRSRRAQRAFVPVDCGAIPENLLEGEFFGHERGAFTGAQETRIGLLEFADGGTFFLDELGELPLPLQAKLLRTLQERRIRRVGGRQEIDVDVRIVAATARDLDAMVRQQTFRQDLYYRIHVVRIDLPPLRQRGDDLGLLAEHFATRYSREMGKSLLGITPEAYQVLSHYQWPGNVRELQNVIRRAITFAQGTMIGLADLPDSLVQHAGQGAVGGAGAPLGYFELRDQHLAAFERNYLRELLARHHGDVKMAAAEALLPRGTLYRLMKNHALDGAEFR